MEYSELTTGQPSLYKDGRDSRSAYRRPKYTPL